jgi:hypothetical protein
MKKQLKMKKQDISILCMMLTLVMLLCIIPLKTASTDYSDTVNIIDARVEIVTEEELPKYTKEIKNKAKAGGAVVEAGDYRVTVCITNNTGFGATGMRVFFDDENFEPRTYNNGKEIVPFIIKNKQAFSGVSFNQTYSADRGLVGWGSMSTEDNDEDGEICSFFFRLKDGADPAAAAGLVRKLEAIQWKSGGVDAVPVQHTIINGGFYFRQPMKYADANGDGDVSEADAQFALQLAATLMNEGKSMNDFYFGDTYKVANSTRQYQICELSGMTDVNADGETDLSDAQDILIYYVESVLTGAETENNVVGVYQWIGN